MARPLRTARRCSPTPSSQGDIISSALPADASFYLHVPDPAGIPRWLARTCLLPPAQHLRVYDCVEDGRNPSARARVADLIRPKAPSGHARRRLRRPEGTAGRVLLLMGVAICAGVGGYCVLLVAAKSLLSIPTRVEHAD